ncbi:MAG: hypothetical protein U9Q63_02605 [Patescibacteria group bacterium]|nr:hypothetical protein [Patescibacteria group bacterium]
MEANQLNQTPTPTASNQQPANTTTPITTTPPPQPTPKKKKPWLLVFIIVLLLSATGVLGYKYYQLQQKVTGLQQSKPAPTPSPQLVVSSPSPVLSPTKEVDPTADWKTYTNTLASYSFRYPPHWLLLESPGDKDVEVYYQPDRTQPVGELLIEISDKVPRDIAQYKDQKVVGNLPAKCKSDPTVKTWCYLKTKTSNISILIIRDQDSEYNDTLDQILSTFKFTK